MKRSAGDEARVKILDAGLELFPDITPSNIARHLGLSNHAAVIYHYPNGTLRDAVAEWALLCDHSRIILQLIGMNHEYVSEMTPEEKRRHFEAV